MSVCHNWCALGSFIGSSRYESRSWQAWVFTPNTSPFPSLKSCVSVTRMENVGTCFDSEGVTTLWHKPPLSHVFWRETLRYYKIAQVKWHTQCQKRQEKVTIHFLATSLYKRVRCFTEAPPVQWERRSDLSSHAVAGKRARSAQGRPGSRFTWVLFTCKKKNGSPTSKDCGGLPSVLQQISNSQLSTVCGLAQRHLATRQMFTQLNYSFKKPVKFIQPVIIRCANPVWL